MHVQLPPSLQSHAVTVYRECLLRIGELKFLTHYEERRLGDFYTNRICRRQAGQIKLSNEVGFMDGRTFSVERRTALRANKGRWVAMITGARKGHST